MRLYDKVARNLFPFLKKDLSLYIKNCKLQGQVEALYRLGYTTLGKYKLQS